MADVAGAFLAGHQIGNQEREHQAAMEQNKLHSMILKHQLDALKIEDQIRSREIAKNQAQMMEGQPQADLPQEPNPGATLPAQNLSQILQQQFGGQSQAPQFTGGMALPAAQAPDMPQTRNVAQQIPGIDAFNGAPAVSGISIRPQSREDLAASAIATRRAEQPGQIVPEGATLIQGGRAVYTNPNQKAKPLDEEALAALQAGDLRKFENIIRTKEAIAKASKDPAQEQQLATLRALEIAAKQQGLGAGGQAPLGVSGPEAIANYPADQQRVIKLLAAYKMPLPSGFALRSPYWQSVLAGASAYDPTFDASQYPVRLKTRQDFTSGQAASTVNALNTAVGHLDTLSKRAEELSNLGAGIPGTTTANYLKNLLKTSAGSPAVKNFNTARDAVASELTKVFRGSGGSESDVKSWQANIDSAGSPEQLKGAIQQAIELMQSRLQALQSQYEKGIGKPADFSFLMPKSQKILDALGSAETAASPASTKIGRFDVVIH